MKTLMTLTMTLAGTAALLASPPPGAPLAEIAGSAKKLEADARLSSQHLRSKTADLAMLRADIEASAADIEKLEELVASYDASKPALSGAQAKTWDTVKTKVQLLRIFYDKKKELAASDDLKKNRSLLRAHADGLAERAAMLQKLLASL